MARLILEPKWGLSDLTKKNLREIYSALKQGKTVQLSSTKEVRWGTLKPINNKIAMTFNEGWDEPWEIADTLNEKGCNIDVDNDKEFTYFMEELPTTYDGDTGVLVEKTISMPKTVKQVSAAIESLEKKLIKEGKKEWNLLLSMCKR